LHIIDIDTLNGPINLTSPSAVTNETFSKALSTELRRPCLLSTPPPLLKLMFGEMADLLLFGQNIVPQKLVNSGFGFKHGELVQALKDLLK
jgi:NAD dependent epimerase/dehydratase family enzyme